MMVFTDASFSKKPPVSGCGIIILDKNNKVHRVGSSSRECKNNNVAEVWAIASAIDFIMTNKQKHFKDDKTITIFTDSEYALVHLDSDTHPNEYETQLYTFINEARAKFNIKFFHIKGHVHDGTKLHFYNNEADELAKEMRLQEKEKDDLFMQEIIKKKFKKRD